MSSLPFSAVRLICLGGFLLGALLNPAEGRCQLLSVQGLPTLGGEAEDRFRLDQLLGRAPGEGYLLRTPSSLLTSFLQKDSLGWSVTLLAPEVKTVWNSDLPNSSNDGALWAGRGWNAQVTAGLRIRAGPATLVLAPHYLFQANETFQVIPFSPWADSRRDPFAHPFHPIPVVWSMFMR